VPLDKGAHEGSVHPFGIEHVQQLAQVARLLVLIAKSDSFLLRCAVDSDESSRSARIQRAPLVGPHGVVLTEAGLD